MEQPDEVTYELALTAPAVRDIYFARRRFVRRFIQVLEDAQNEHEGTTGQRQAWVEDVVDLFGDPDVAVIDELVIFVQAMVAWARTTTATATVLALQGNGREALRMVDHLESEIRADYFNLHNRLRALAKAPPDLGRLGGVLPGGRRAQEAYGELEWLADEMARTIGINLPERDEELAVVVDRGV